MIMQGKVRHQVGWSSFAAAAVAASCLLVGESTASTNQIPGASPAVDRSSAVDAMVFFDELIARYRRIDVYQDVTVVRETTTPPEGPARTSERRIAVEVREDNLSVETTDAAWRRRLGLDRGSSSTKAMQKLQQRYRLWLAPHASLRFALEPLLEWRQPSSDTLTPTSASPVMVDNRELVQISLRGGDTASADCPKYDLYVNPESMLIERIEGEEHLADGWARTTRLDITPIFVRDQTATGTAEEQVAANETATDEADEIVEDVTETLDVFTIDETDGAPAPPEGATESSPPTQTPESRPRTTGQTPPPGAALGPRLLDPPVFIPPGR